MKKICTFANEIDLPNKHVWGGREVSAVREVRAKEIKLLRVQTETNKKKHGEEGGRCQQGSSGSIYTVEWRRMVSKERSLLRGERAWPQLQPPATRTAPHFTKDLVITPFPTPNLNPNTHTHTHTHTPRRCHSSSLMTNYGLHWLHLRVLFQHHAQVQ